MRLAGKSIARFSFVMLTLLIAGLIFNTIALADPNFNLDNFRTKWQRADKPVNDLTASPGRSWLWGPEGFSPASGITEPYAESPGGTRTVEYFDKARMELNNPSTGLVTNGLLVRELIAGRLATGDAAYTQRRAADDIPVAGDPSGNDGPTYASFARVASLNNDNPSSDRTGQAVSDTLDKAGNVSNNPAIRGDLKYVYFDQGLKHNIPNVFWDFMNQRGNVYVNGGLQNNQPVLGDNPAAPWLDATGLPITDAYWAKVTLAGKATDVLIQAFERRVLTYTPSNPAAYQVEMGNVGRHYFTWRYNSSYDLAPASTPTPQPTAAPQGCAALPPLPETISMPVRCGPAGYAIYFMAPFTKNEKINITPIDPAGQRYGIVNTYTTSNTDSVLADMIWTNPKWGTGQWTFELKGTASGITYLVTAWLTPALTEPTVIANTYTITISSGMVVMGIGFPANEAVVVTSYKEGVPIFPKPYKFTTNPFGGFTFGFSYPLPDVPDTYGQYTMVFEVKGASYTLNYKIVKS